jgi:hypothetical protein
VQIVHYEMSGFLYGISSFLPGKNIHDIGMLLLCPLQLDMVVVLLFVLKSRSIKDELASLTMVMDMLLEFQIEPQWLNFDVVLLSSY